MTRARGGDGAALQRWSLALVVLIGLVVAAGCEDPVVWEADSGFIYVAIQSRGSAFDANGFVLLANGEPVATDLELNETLRVFFDQGGRVELELTDVASNCLVEQGSRRAVVLPDKRGANVRFDVICEAPKELAPTRLLMVRSGNLYSTRADGTDTTTLTSAGRGVDPAVSPNGSRIAFMRESRIYVMEADGSTPRRVSEVASRAPDFSPEGSRLVYREGDGVFEGQLRILDLDSGELDSVPALGFDDHPRWSPDGSWIAFTRFAHPEQGGSGVYIVEPEGGDAVFAANGTRPVWSPDSEMIAYTRDDDVFIKNLGDGRERHLLTMSHPGWITDWSPGGQWIALSIRRDFYIDVYLANVVDGGMVRISADGLSHSAVFAPAHVQF